MTLNFRIVLKCLFLTKTGAPGFAKMQFKKSSCSNISGNGSPFFVSSMSHFVTLSPRDSQKSIAPVPTLPKAPTTRIFGNLFSTFTNAFLISSAIVSLLSKTLTGPQIPFVFCWSA